MDKVNVLYITVAVVFAFIAISKTIKQKIVERDGLFWIFISLVMLLLGFWPGLIDRLAIIIGISYPPALLFLMSTVVLLYIVLRQSIAISQLHQRVIELAQRVAIIDMENRNNINLFGGKK